MGEEGRIGAVGNDQGPAEMGFQEGAENDPHDNRRGREVGMLHEITDNSENKSYVNFGHAVVSSIRTGNGDHQDEG